MYEIAAGALLIAACSIFWPLFDLLEAYVERYRAETRAKYPEPITTTQEEKKEIQEEN